MATTASNYCSQGRRGPGGRGRPGGARRNPKAGAAGAHEDEHLSLIHIYLISITQLPPGASLARTDAVVQEVSKRLLKIDGIRGTIMLPGYDAASNTNSPNTATAFIPLKPFEERSRPALSLIHI